MGGRGVTMYLYSLTLQKAGGIQQAVYGSFSAPKAQEIVVSHGKSLELLSPDSEGRLVSLFYTEVFGCILSMAPFRLTGERRVLTSVPTNDFFLGGNRDYLVVGSDSGKITILLFDVEKSCFQKIHQETFGKSGCRRIVPGTYLCCDPRGRAVMIGTEKFAHHSQS